MYESKTQLTEFEERLDVRLGELKQMIIDGDKETYHKMSLLLHQMSPETKNSIENIRQRLEKYESGMLDIKDEMKETKELLKRYLPAMEAVSDVLAGNRTLKRVAQFLGYVGAIATGIYALKNWIR